MCREGCVPPEGVDSQPVHSLPFLGRLKDKVERPLGCAESLVGVRKQRPSFYLTGP